MIDSPLCVICDADVCGESGRTLVEVADRCLQGGARHLQVRAKQATSWQLLAFARSVVEAARAVGALVIVNDRADIAKLADAGGVHVGQDDLRPAAVRAIVGERAVIGLSTHTLLQLRAAVGEPITYAAIGPVFGTRSKVAADDPVGVEGVRRAAAITRPRGMKLIAIGGITLDWAAAVIEAGADTVAVIRDVVAAADPERRVQAYLQQLR